MEKNWYVRVVEEEEVRRDDPIECFLPTEIRSTFWAIEGVMAIEVPQNEEISGGGKNGWRKRVGSAIRRRANGGSINIKEWEWGGVVKRDVDFYIVRVGIKQGKRGVESSEKDKSCLMKTMTPPLACVASEKKYHTGSGCDQIIE